MPSQPIPAVFTLPGGEAPFPAIIVLHGCDGPGQGGDIWAERLRGWGYATLVTDSYAPRGVKRVCAGPAEERSVTPQDRAGDVISAALWLRTRPEIDPARIGVIGSSNGGWTAVWITQRRYQQRYPGLIRAAVAYYGGCVHPEDHGTVPLLALAGEADDWAFPAQACRDFAAKLAPGQGFEMHTYPGAAHCFECEGLRSRDFSEGHLLEYDWRAARDSFVRTKAFLDRNVGRWPPAP
jgi:dienelactone hydrolase